jgi:hypothetical protein
MGKIKNLFYSLTLHMAQDFAINSPVKHWCEFEFISKTVKNPNIHIRGTIAITALFGIVALKDVSLDIYTINRQHLQIRSISFILVTLSALVRNA